MDAGRGVQDRSPGAGARGVNRRTPMKTQAKAERRTKQAGRDASAASLATDLALVREENKALREERDRLKKAVQRSLGARLDQAGTKES